MQKYEVRVARARHRRTYRRDVGCMARMTTGVKRKEREAVAGEVKTYALAPRPAGAIAWRLRAVPEGPGSDAAVQTPAYRTIAVAMRPMAPPVVVFPGIFATVFVSVPIVTRVFSAVDFDLAAVDLDLALNLYDEIG